MRAYSRRSKTEEKRNKRKAFFLLVLSFIMIGVFAVYGLPTAGRFMGFLYDISTSSRPLDAESSVFLPSPNVDTLPAATNKKTIDVRGSAQPGTTVVVYINGDPKETLSNSEGEFLQGAILKKGTNVIYAIAKDKSGEESGKSREQTIIFDDEAPVIKLTKPSDGDEFFGSGQRRLTIEGSTEKESKLVINGRFVLVDEGGNFMFTVTLNEGENTFHLIADDEAGNRGEETVTVRYYP
jgi:hypothetical protein